MRWKVPLPGRDWPRWWYAYLAHAFTGFSGSFGALWFVSDISTSVVIFSLAPIIECFRQLLGYLRKNDTPSRDVGDVLVGYIIGLVAGGIKLGT